MVIRPGALKPMSKILHRNGSARTPHDHSYGGSTKSSCYPEYSLHETTSRVISRLGCRWLFLRLTWTEVFCKGGWNGYTLRYGFGTLRPGAWSGCAGRRQDPGDGRGCSDLAEPFDRTNSVSLPATEPAIFYRCAALDGSGSAAGDTHRSPGEANDGGCGSRRKKIR